MSATFGSYGPTYPRLGALGERVARAVATPLYRRARFHTPDDDYAQKVRAEIERRLSHGRPSLLLGVGPAGHNSGAALVEVSSGGAVNLVCNEEEERYAGVKHCRDFPVNALEAIKLRLRAIGARPSDILACVATWDYVQVGAMFVRCSFEEFPGPIVTEPPVDMNFGHVLEARGAPRRIGEQLGVGGPLPVIGIRHHDTHSHFSYAVSPFAREREPTLIVVSDGFGDDCSLSIYVGRNGQVELDYKNASTLDSLGIIYGTVSATQGGWPPFSSEGRYMGAAAWGNGDRLTNAYYRRLRQLVYFGPDGELRLNRAFANWQRRALGEPYARELIDILGPPIPKDRMWNPDAILSVDDVEHAEVTRDRVDKAAALQLLFEDGLVHVIEHAIRRTGAQRLVLTGGTALNCLANMRLLERFDEAWYERTLGVSDARLHLWAPPTPGDAGAPHGACYALAMQSGAVPGEPLRHAFYCGEEPTTESILRAIEDEGAQHAVVGQVHDGAGRAAVADLLAALVADDGVVGLYQGAAETGPRALGHRSILANPCNPATRETINSRVKYRERIRPLAPMATLEEARRLFELADGAADDDYNAYNYMVLAAPARPVARELVPAVVHRDGTSRVQIVRRSTDPLSHAFLEAMGRRVGVEVAVNTSLNVGSPIVQTPRQAIDALRKARGMDGILMVGADGTALMTWLDESRPRDAAERFERWRAGMGREPARSLEPPRVRDGLARTAREVTVEP
jgi:carbamoyltransferase